MKSNIHRKLTHQYKNETTEWHQCHKRLNRKKFRLISKRESLFTDVLYQCKEVTNYESDQENQESLLQA